MAQQFVMGQLKVSVALGGRLCWAWVPRVTGTKSDSTRDPFFPQGFSAHWWNFRHFQHHAKPNIFHKDPDVTVAPVFLLGESSVEVGGMGHDDSRERPAAKGAWQGLRPHACSPVHPAF